jgi:hypothetical protein
MVEFSFGKIPDLQFPNENSLNNSPLLHCKRNKVSTQ